MTIERELAALADRFCKMNCPIHAEQNWPHDPDCQTLRAATAALTPSARITGDKDRGNPVEGAPYGEGLIGRIDQLEAANRRLAITAHSLRSVLRTIAEMGYVDHQSGNQNFKVLQSVARGGLESNR